jgi:ElaB/YqjD/DUF883 family membrane-anchored ribosome-binding protein
MTAMTTADQAYRRAANSPAGRAASDTARSIGEDVSDFASDMSRKAGKQFGRAQDMAVDAYEEMHDASVRNPHISLALALGVGFLLGAILTGRR